jgi:hypothetical protein
MRIKLPLQWLYFIAGVFVAVLILSVCKGSKPPAIQTIETQKIETLTVWRVKKLAPETIRVERMVAKTKNDTVIIERPVIINWREYQWEDKRLKLNIVADTVRKVSYKIKEFPKEAGVLVSTQSLMFYGTPTRNLILGVGWNFRLREPEIMVGVRFRL